MTRVLRLPLAAVFLSYMSSVSAAQQVPEAATTTDPPTPAATERGAATSVESPAGSEQQNPPASPPEPPGASPSSEAAPADHPDVAPPLPTVPKLSVPREDSALEVTVVGTRLKQTAGSAHVLRAKQLERLDYDDPQAVVASVPGVYSRGEDGVGLRPNIGLRGANPDRSKKVTLMEDGVLFGPAPYSAPAAYYFPLITRMSQVRVIKGPGAISFGPQTVGGAIDLTTRPLPSLQSSGGMDLAGGEYGYRKGHAHFGASSENTAFVIEGVHLADDGFKYLPNGTDIGFHRNEWMFKGAHRLNPIAGRPHELRLKLTYSDEDSRETYLGLSDADFKRSPLMRYDASQLDRMKYFRTSAVLTHGVQLSERATLTTDVYRHDFTRSWRKVNGFRGASLFDVLTNPTDPQNQIYLALLTGQIDSSAPGESLLVGPNERTYVSEGVQTRLRWDPTTGSVSHRIESSVRAHFDSIDRRHSQDAFTLQAGQLVATNTPTQITALNGASTFALAAHVADAVTWKRLTVTPGVRLEFIWSEFSDQLTSAQGDRFVAAVLPGVGIYQGMTDTFGLLGGVHRGFSPPAPGADRSIQAESSVNYEAGARYAKGALQAEVIGFLNDYSNLTDVCTLSSGCLDMNLDRQYDAGAALIRGVEVYGRHDQRVGRFTIPATLAYTYTRTRFDTDFASEDPIFGAVKKGDEMPYVPRHTLNASLGLEHLRGGVIVAANYVSAMREQAGSAPLSQVIATDEMFTVDVSGRVRLYGSWSLYTNVRNVFNEHYIVSRRPFGARPNIPRWVQVGLRASF